MEPIYLDYNGTTPIDPEVAKAMQPFIDKYFGNPSSVHAFGEYPEKALEKARVQVAHMLRCDADEVIFTSGGSESNNLAVKGAVQASGDKGGHIIASSIEHPSIIEVCKFLAHKGFRVTYLPVDGYGLVDPESVEKAIMPRTVLITIMHANNEVGTIEPVEQIAQIARSRGILFHSDCAQSIGKMPVHAEELGADLITVAGHKVYAPKGVGALYIRRGVKIQKQIHGAGQEKNLRAGTENILGITGLGRACELVANHLKDYSSHLKLMRDRLEQGLKSRFPDIRINGHPEKRLPNTSSISFPDLKANEIVSGLHLTAASAGAACHSQSTEISAVLKAMGVPLNYALGTIRFSTGRYTSKKEIDLAVDEILKVVKGLQA